MRSLFAFLWKYQFIVLFVVLEVVSLLLLMNSYSYQRSLAYNTTNNITGSMLEAYNDVSEYFFLHQVNEELLQENALLRHQQVSSFLFTDTSIVYRDSLYRFIPASVVSTSVNRQNNYLLINKGSRHGIRKEMGVISASGVAGIVTGVSERYAYVMSLLHQNTRISARIKTSGELVNVTWDGKDPVAGTVRDIPSHVALARGDTIITSGNSLIFPEGIPVGTITAQETSVNKALGTASMAFSTDFSTLRFVYVIDNLMKEEQEQLMNEQKDE